MDENDIRSSLQARTGFEPDDYLVDLMRRRNLDPSVDADVIEGCEWAGIAPSFYGVKAPHEARNPKAEWFSKWSSWMILTEAGQWWHVDRVTGFTPDGYLGRQGRSPFRWSIKGMVKCFPVRADIDLPFPVSWERVGGCTDG